jgi:hypothetical protein
LELGRWSSAQELYGYYNSLDLLAVKRPHAWANPTRQAAAILRKQETGFWGFGRGSP